MSPSVSRRTVTLRDGARVTLRPIAPEDQVPLAAAFERLGDESRYRRFCTGPCGHPASVLADIVAYCRDRYGERCWREHFWQRQLRTAALRYLCRSAWAF